MKKSFVGPLVTTIILLVIAALFVYFYLSLNRLEKRAIAMQQVIAEDSGKIGAVVNFFNSNVNAQTK